MKKIWWVLCTFLLASGCVSYDNTSDILIKQPSKNVAQLKALNFQLENNITTLDPVFAQTKEERQICALVFDCVVNLDNDTVKLVNGLAEKWEISPDAKKYSFLLYKKTRFHNGIPLKASDIKFSWERAVRVNSPEKYIFSNIVGYWDFITGKSPEITGIKVIDDRNIEVDLVTQDKDFLISLTAPAASVVDRYQVINNADVFGKPGTDTKPALSPNGSGKYKLYNWIKDKNITLGLNYNYYAIKPKIARLDIALTNDKESFAADYELNTLDCISNITQEDLSENTSLKGRLQSVPLAEISLLRIDPTNKMFSDIRVRHALMMAIEFRRIGLYLNNDNFLYLPGNITTYLSSGNALAEKESVLYDAYKASQLLAETGHQGGKGLDFTLYYPDQPQYKKIALLLKGQWSARGINATPVGVSLHDLRVLKANKTAAVYIDEWQASFPALETFFYPNFHSAFGTGISPQVDSMIADALFTADNNQKQSKFNALEILLEEQYIIRPLFRNSMSVLIKPYVTNLTCNRLGLLSITNADIGKRQH